MSKTKNSSETSSGSTVSPEALFEALQTQYSKLRDRKISVETQKSSVSTQLDALQAAAQEQFGTHDVAELKKKLEQMQAENEKKLNDYQETLDGIDAQLAEIDDDLKTEEKSA